MGRKAYGADRDRIGDLLNVIQATTAGLCPRHKYVTDSVEKRVKEETGQMIEITDK